VQFLSILRLLLRWFFHALALLIVTYIVPGFHVASFSAALIAVLIIGFLNMTLGLLLKAITLPLGILTLGIFFLVINAIILLFASRIAPGFRVDNFGAAFIGAVVLAIVHVLFSMITD
jgi:putative membrane protein